MKFGLVLLNSVATSLTQTPGSEENQSSGKKNQTKTNKQEKKNNEDYHYRLMAVDLNKEGIVVFLLFLEYVKIILLQAFAFFSLLGILGLF